VTAVADACPVCQPGIPDPADPVHVVAAPGGGTWALYACPDCGAVWETLAGADGWTDSRRIITTGDQREHC
jgi:hypothetical protein